MCKVYGAGQIRDKIPTTYTYRVDRGMEGGLSQERQNRSGLAKGNICHQKSAPVILGLEQHCDAHGKRCQKIISGIFVKSFQRGCDRQTVRLQLSRWECGVFDFGSLGSMAPGKATALPTPPRRLHNPPLNPDKQKNTAGQLLAPLPLPNSCARNLQSFNGLKGHQCNRRSLPNSFLSHVGKSSL